MVGEWELSGYFGYGSDWTAVPLWADQRLPRGRGLNWPEVGCDAQSKVMVEVVTVGDGDLVIKDLPRAEATVAHTELPQVREGHLRRRAPPEPAYGRRHCISPGSCQFVVFAYFVRTLFLTMQTLSIIRDLGSIFMFSRPAYQRAPNNCAGGRFVARRDCHKSEPFRTQKFCRRDHENIRQI
jgi:hypothetical protein